MTFKIYSLAVAIASLLFSGVVFAGGLPSVKIIGSAVLTYPADTHRVCIKELHRQGCSGQNCQVGGKTLTFNNCPHISLTLQGGAGSRCGNSQAELFLSPSGSTYDISLVNGFNVPVTISGGPTISANSPTAKGKGVYPFGCSMCTSRIKKDCGYSKSNPHPLTAGCSKSADCQITNDGSPSYTVTFGG